MKKFLPFLSLFGIAVIVAVLNQWILEQMLSEAEYDTFLYSIPVLYLVFGLTSLVIFLIQKRIKDKNPEQLGYAFLLLSSVKLALSYAMLYPVLERPNGSGLLEKNNFFVVFLIFLAMDVVLTSRLLKDVGKKD